jgi:8-amino-7-oxononanoate synthase
MSFWSERIRAQLDDITERGQWRSPREFDANGPSGLLEDSPVTSFASNDYLGLSTHPNVVEAAREATARWGAGSGASRLVTGSRPVHRQLEEELAAWKQMPSAVCFPTGFSANLGVLNVFGGPGVRVFSDELNHASIIDGCRLSRSEVSIYRHCDVAHLASLLADCRSTPTIVVTDTVFSMDGDLAPLEQVGALCRESGSLLVLDEAHAVLGPHVPPSFCSDDELLTIRVGTLSKMLGSLGGFVAASTDAIDLLVNRARPYIFSTALTPGDAAAALASLRILRSDEGDRLVERLAYGVARVAGAALGTSTHSSPIIPVIVGSERRALAVSAALLADGIWVPAIRPPTVPAGTSRLRVTLSAAHTDGQISELIEALDSLGVLPEMSGPVRS